jgi:elongation factor P--beta-lysine ligase
MELFKQPDCALTIIREPLVDALRYYIDQNTMLFQTKGAMLEWYKKLVDTKTLLDDMNNIL